MVTRTEADGRTPSSAYASSGKLVDVRLASHQITPGLLTVAGISFALMQTLVVPALPFFVREFDTSAAWVTWLVTSFLVSSSVLTPILGKLGDAHGKKKLLVISLAVFGFASLGASLAPNIGVLIVFRALQGVGGRRSSRSASESSATSSRRRRWAWRSGRSAPCSESAVASAWCSAA